MWPLPPTRVRVRVPSCSHPYVAADQHGFPHSSPGPGCVAEKGWQQHRFVRWRWRIVAGSHPHLRLVNPNLHARSPNLLAGVTVVGVDVRVETYAGGLVSGRDLRQVPAPPLGARRSFDRLLQIGRPRPRPHALAVLARRHPSSRSPPAPPRRRPDAMPRSTKAYNPAPPRRGGRRAPPQDLGARGRIGANHE